MNIKQMTYSTSIAGILFISSGPFVYAGAMGSAAVAPMGTIYVGAFGGGGSVDSGNVNQQGTALYAYGSGSGSINNGGPLAVNAEGESASSSAWLAGGHLGYRWPSRALHHMSSNWSLSPAVELEGYYIGGTTIKANDLNNDTTRLVEHDFNASYPMRTGVALVNAVLNTNNTDFGQYHPYLGVGLGAAVIAISGANSTQKSPSEPGVNHYNSNASDTSSTFAVQPKLGLTFDVNQTTSMFIEYRFLYLAANNYTFGSTVYPTHVATTNWDVKIGSQYYNVGTLGIQYDL